MARIAAGRGSLPRSWEPFDPFRIIYRLLTSVRVALLLLGAVAVAALLGVVFPQAPDEVRAVPASFDAYVEFQRGRYHIFAPLMRDLGLFSVFHSYWFNGLVVVLLLAVTVCTANRIPPIARNVRRPIRRVNDRYFEHAHHRASFTTPPNAGAIVQELKRHHYKVQETRREGDTTYFFADRLSWTQFGTFVSHLALILFMAGAIVTKVVGFNSEISIPEGRTEPVFATIHANQMQVMNVHAAEDTNAQGQITRYHSDLAVFKNGKQICQGTSTVNNPMHCAGYVFHQTNFSPYGVELRVRDLTTGQTVYDEVNDLGISGRTPSPHLIVHDAAGNTLFDDNVVLAPQDPSLATMYAVLPLRVGGKTLPLLLVGQAQGKSDWTFKLFHPADASTPGDSSFDLSLPVGGSASANGLSFSLPALTGLPLAAVQGIPGIATAAILQEETSVQGQQYLDVLDMGSSQLGIGTAATGDTSGAVASGPGVVAAAPGQVGAAPPADAASGQANAPAGAPPTTGRLDLVPNVPQKLGNYEYTFLGNRSVTGITVRKDPGSMFIWIATGLLLLGLAITFYLPRRRMWLKVTPERTFMAGIADRVVDFAAEMRRMGAAAGSPDAANVEEEPASPDRVPIGAAER